MDEKERAAELGETPKDDGKSKKKNLLTEWEGSMKLRAYFTKMLGDNSPEGVSRVIAFGKKALFVVVLVVELLILTQHVERWINGGNWISFTIMSMIAVVLSVAETVNLFVLKEERHRAWLYVVEVGAAFVYLLFTAGSYSLFLFILVLTQLYLDIRNGRTAMWVYFGALVLYALSYSVQVYFTHGDLILFDILRDSFGALSALTLHFFGMQCVFAFYRQYVRLNRTLAELDESKKELEKAYAVVAEVSALEERQRIAKDIHDTAGHSLTTVIMQTEAAKRIIEENPEEAKMKIVAANLQAKNTLERLRESVHLLSGTTEGTTLKTVLEGIVHETTDGTGIRIRSEIEDIAVSPSKSRFLCNTLREGISNGLRHGNATAFWFELKSEDGRISFLLSDNGVGLQGKKLKKGFGLTTMRDRAKAFGGEVSFLSQPDEGFELRLILPADAEE